jgi:hypothetical protein
MTLVIKCREKGFELKRINGSHRNFFIYLKLIIFVYSDMNKKTPI